MWKQQLGKWFLLWMCCVEKCSPVESIPRVNVHWTSNLKENGCSTTNPIFASKYLLLLMETSYLMEKHLIECRIFSLTIYRLCNKAKKLWQIEVRESMIELAILVRQFSFVLRKCFAHKMWIQLSWLKSNIPKHNSENHFYFERFVKQNVRRRIMFCICVKMILLVWTIHIEMVKLSQF